MKRLLLLLLITSCSPASAQGDVRVTFNDIEDGTEFTTGRQELTGRVYGEPGDDGRVQLYLDGAFLGADAVSSQPGGAVWIIQADLQDVGEHKLSATYSEAGYALARTDLNVTIAPAGASKDIQTLPVLELVSQDRGGATVRLDYLGKAVGGSWRLVVDGYELQTGAIPQLPQVYYLELGAGRHDVSLSWAFDANAVDRVIVTMPETNTVPAPLLVLPLLAAAWLQRR